jgi:hypothetical protein
LLEKKFQYSVWGCLYILRDKTAGKLYEQKMSNYEEGQRMDCFDFKHLKGDENGF